MIMNRIALPIILIISLVFMWYLATINGYVQYHWDVRMDGITLFFGPEPLSEFDLIVSHFLLVAFSAFSVLVAVEHYIKGNRSIRFLVILFTVFIAYIAIVSPLSITAIILFPMIILHLFILSIGVRVTFIVKIAIALGAVVILSLAYRVNRVNSE